MLNAGYVYVKDLPPFRGGAMLFADLYVPTMECFVYLGPKVFSKLQCYVFSNDY